MSVDTLGLDYAKVNPSGGAIALGHPLGVRITFLLSLDAELIICGKKLNRLPELVKSLPLCQRLREVVLRSSALAVRLFLLFYLLTTSGLPSSCCTQCA